MTVGIAKELMRFNIPIERIVAATVAASDKVTRSTCASEVSEASKTDTPYGVVAEEIVMPLSGGGETKLYYNNPFALLHAACAKKQDFGSFLHQLASLV